MPQYITIKNFGPITSIEKMEVKDFMLFIGERSTGKSTIAKLIFFFKTIDDDVYNTLYSYHQFRASGNFEYTLKSTISHKFNETFSQIIKIIDIDEDFEILFQYNDHDSKNYIRINKSSISFGETLEKLNNESIEEIKLILQPSAERNHEKFQQMKGDFFFKKLYDRIGETYNVISCAYIPAQRVSLSANISDKSYSGFHDIISENYKDLLQDFRNSFKTDESGNDLITILKNYEKEILRGSSISIAFGGRDSLILENGKEIPLVSASSGFQEIGWFFVVLKFLASRKYPTLAVAEEPESHLDPKGQSLIMEAIAAFGNHKVENKYNQVIITTHSPFILGRLNNILYASKLSKEHMDEVLGLGFKPEILLDPERVAAYKCVDGGIVSILSDGLVENEEVDNISDKTLNDLDLLIDLDLKYEKTED